MANRPPDLHFEPFEHRHQIDGFDCGNHGLNEFVHTEQVFWYQRERLGRTSIVRNRKTWETIAYYTIAPHSLRIQHAKKVPRIRPEYVVEEYPSLMLGRLAVHSGWQRRGVGRLVLAKICLDALDDDALPFRLVVLAAERDSVPFYQKFGFQFTDKRQNEKRHKPMMYYDLMALRDALGQGGPRTAEPQPRTWRT